MANTDGDWLSLDRALAVVTVVGLAGAATAPIAIRQGVRPEQWAAWVAAASMAVVGGLLIIGVLAAPDPVGYSDPRRSRLRPISLLALGVLLLLIPVGVLVVS